jgi:hydroxyacylglutathione hydrolase
MQQEIKTINLGGVNCYLVNTEKGFILVDTGLADKRTTLEKALEQAGCVPGKLDLIILTHGDIDHSGNCAYLRTKYGTKIAIHPADTEMVKSGQLLKDRKVTSLLLRTIQFLSKSSFTKMMDQFERFTPDLFLEEGQRLDDYGFNASVLHIPGHTPGSIALLSAAGDLICGDTLQNYTKPLPTVIIADTVQLAESVKRLKNSPARMVYPGHGKPFPMSLFLKQ